VVLISLDENYQLNMKTKTTKILHVEVDFGKFESFVSVFFLDKFNLNDDQFVASVIFVIKLPI
jgi:hypothetical protein